MEHGRKNRISKLLAAIASAALVLGLMPSVALAAVETQETQEPQKEPAAVAVTAQAVIDDAAQGEDGEGSGGDALEAEGLSAQLMTAQAEEPDGEPRITTMATETYFENGITYELNTETKTATVTGYESGLSGNVIIPEKITNQEIDYTVTAIGDHAFIDCAGLTSVTISKGVTSIGVQAFQNCSGLQSVTIPDSVTSIGSYAFQNCIALGSITIPGSVTSIGNNAFCECVGLGSVTISKGVASIGDYAFIGCSGLQSVTIPDSVTSIGSYAFQNCTGLGSITIPSEMTSIENGVFHSCAGLTSVTIPNSVTSIGSYAFQNCIALTSIDIPAGVTSVSPGTFNGCASLTSVTIQGSVTAIGDSAFYDCKKLNTIAYGGTLESWNGINRGYFWADFTPSDMVVVCSYGGAVTADPAVGGKASACGKTYPNDSSKPDELVATAQLNPGYDFDGWTGGDGVKFDDAFALETTFTVNIGTPTITANFKPKTYTITWEQDDGTVIDRTSVEPGKVPTHADPTKKADAQYTYTFKGWTPEVVAATEDATYRATYSKTAKAGSYEVASGSGQTWEKGSTDPVTLTIKGAIGDAAIIGLFKGVEVDGKAVTEKDAASGKANWTAEKGSLILSLQPAFLETLSDGDHTVKVLFEDGSAEATFKVTSKAAPADSKASSAKTGDALPLMAVMVTLLLSGAMIAVSRRKLWAAAHPVKRGKHAR